MEFTKSWAVYEKACTDLGVEVATTTDEEKDNESMFFLLTAAQSLARPLNKGETRAALLSKLKDLAPLKSLPEPVRVLIFWQAPDLPPPPEESVSAEGGSG